jgi:uncharacterized OB-fold protein
MEKYSMRLNCRDHVRFVDGAPRLLGSRCTSCGEQYFPASPGCTRCCSMQMEPVELGDRGTLWAFTTQGFLPKAPYDGGQQADTFKPYGVGYVEMPSGVKVESRLTVGDAERLKVGMPMHLVIEAYGAAADGTSLGCYAFAPTVD